ncbi:MAG: proline--tRNA ligase [Deltaproteobacteria bacterium]|nr:MAG: proline--tRNA ligase [Deltaproteobacteria bacterium]
MRYSRYLLPTLREDPAEAEVTSHKLMIRAGMIRKVAAGIYDFLPLGLRVLRKVEAIIREEMNRAGAQEVLLPVVLPADLWRESGRWDEYGKEMLRFKDRGDRDYCLGPTHEEAVTDLVRREVRSYKQLPLCLYQIQVKFRDEMRPRFGIMRAREFIMKDAYSFDADEAGAEESYRKMYEAYCRIFRRCGLRFRAVEADTGLIGGRFSHEFMVLASTGEDVIVSCDRCDYAANLERAEIGDLPTPAEDEPLEELRSVETPGRRTVEEVTSFLGVPPERLVKTLIFKTEDGVVAALVRGDHEVNEVKLRNHLGVRSLELADEETIREVTGGPLGFSGPVGLKVRKIADKALKGMRNLVVGGNEEDLHLMGANFGRDFEVDEFADIRKAQQGDPCPRCEGGRLQISRGIEVGHIFKLGTKYSEAMGATFLDQEGKERPFVMGCYGIGVGRTVAAAIEQNHDSDGIIFPASIAPFHIYLLPVNSKDPEVMGVAEDLYRDLTAQGLEVLFDDRDERAGVKFKDADLLGIPFRVTVSERNLKDGKVEVRHRKTKEVTLIQLQEAVQQLREMVHRELEECQA